MVSYCDGKVEEISSCCLPVQLLYRVVPEIQELNVREDHVHAVVTIPPLQVVILFYDGLAYRVPVSGKRSSTSGAPDASNWYAGI